MYDTDINKKEDYLDVVIITVTEQFNAPFFQSMKKSILPFFIASSGNETEPFACLNDAE